MTNATDQARSTRSDARAFADAFAAADDAFTFGADAGESRTLSLSELGDALGLDGAVTPPPAAAPGRTTPSRAASARSQAPADRAEDELLTLDELGEVLARPARATDDLDFDFGTSAHERARRRTAARFDGSSTSRRRASGPAGSARRDDGSVAHNGKRFERHPAASSQGMADAAASAAELLSVPGRGGRFARPAEPAQLREVPRAQALPVPATPARSREPQRAPRTPAVERLRANPDRVAMWAVLLGILLVLIAFTSGSAGAFVLPLLPAL